MHSDSFAKFHSPVVEPAAERSDTASQSFPLSSPDPANKIAQTKLGKDEFLFAKFTESLEFQRRVLAQCYEQAMPSLERLEFFSIVRANLAQLLQKEGPQLLGLEDEGSLPRGTVRRMFQEFNRLMAATWERVLLPTLKTDGIELKLFDKLSYPERQSALNALELFQDRFQIQTLDSTGSFRELFSKGPVLSLIAGLSRDFEGPIVLLIPPRDFPPWLRLNDNGSELYVNSLSVIAMNFRQLVGPVVSAIGLEMQFTQGLYAAEENELFSELPLQHARELLERRSATGVSAVEIRENIKHPAFSRLLLRELSKLNLASGAYQLPPVLLSQSHPLGSLSAITRTKRANLHFDPWQAVKPEFSKGSDSRSSLFSLIAERPRIVSFPYESFAKSVERFVAEAVEDDAVEKISMSIYRLGNNSPFLPLLLRARERGKAVSCLVELRARGDEANNVRIAEELQAAGAEVFFSPDSRKAHLKLILVERLETEGRRVYAHVSSGNYHAETAKLYTDVGIFTANVAVTSELVQFWNLLRKPNAGSLQPEHCLFAPFGMRDRFIALIRREVLHQQNGRPAQIVAKMNAFDDPELALELSAAAEAGVQITLIVRGAFVAPLSEHQNIRVISVVGRLLEHSRIFYFRNGETSFLRGDFFLGSADWLRRNLEDRFEVVIPVEDIPSKGRLGEILEVCLSDLAHIWERGRNGVYVQRTNGPNRTSGISTQSWLMNLARKRDAENHA